MKNSFFLFFLLISGFTFGQNKWLQGKKEWLISPSISHYRANSFRDRKGNKSEFSNEGLFKSYTPKIYFSAPIKPNKINIWGNIPFVLNSYEDNFNRLENNEIGDIDLGVKFHLKNWGKYHVIMGSVSQIIPLYDNDNTPFVGLNQFGTEAKLIISGNFNKWINVNKNFHTLEIGVRQFYNDGPTQIKLYGSQGYRPFNKVTVIGEFEGFLSLDDKEFFTQENVQFITDFSFIKFGLNIGYDFTKKTAIYIGTYEDIFNRNSAVGTVYQIFAVIKLSKTDE